VSAPSVTVSIPTRGRPELARAVDQILAQDHDGPLDVVLVFDQCEPDRSYERDGERPVRVVANERTPGLAGGRNTGILQATGDYVAFTDDDDEWTPDKLSKQFAALAATPSAKVATCGIEIRYKGRSRVRIPDAERMNFEGFLADRQSEAGSCTLLFDRRFLVDEIGLIDEELPGGMAEDYDLLLRVSQKTDFAVVPEALCIVNWGDGSFFSRRWDLTDEALGYLVDKYPFGRVPHGLARIRGQQAVARASMGDRKVAWQHIREALSLRPLEKRAYLAALISTGLVSGEKAMRTANWFGRGI
jgi:glycosyltransferase involved in cell wall biosynthesis